MGKSSRINEKRREARVVYAVTDPGCHVGDIPAQEPQTHYVGSLKHALRMAEFFNRARPGREATVVRIKAPKLSPSRMLLWALNFSDHAGSKHLSYGISAYCDAIRAVDSAPAGVFLGESS